MGVQDRAWTGKVMIHNEVRIHKIETWSATEIFFTKDHSHGNEA